MLLYSLLCVWRYCILGKMCGGKYLKKELLEYCIFPVAYIIIINTFASEELCCCSCRDGNYCYFHSDYIILSITDYLLHGLYMPSTPQNCVDCRRPSPIN